MNSHWEMESWQSMEPRTLQWPPSQLHTVSPYLIENKNSLDHRKCKPVQQSSIFSIMTSLLFLLKRGHPREEIGAGTGGWGTMYEGESERGPPRRRCRHTGGRTGVGVPVINHRRQRSHRDGEAVFRQEEKAKNSLSQNQWESFKRDQLLNRRNCYEQNLTYSFSKLLPQKKETKNALKTINIRASLAVQWLRFRTSTAGGMVSIPAQMH